MSWLDKSDKDKLMKAAYGPKVKGGGGRKKYIRVLIGCTIEFSLDDLDESYVAEVIDKCRECGTGEVVDAKVVYKQE